MSTSTIQQTELERWPQSRIQSQPRNDHVQLETLQTGENVIIQELLPVDGGAAAWRVLIAAFVFEALLWGTRFLYKSLANSINQIFRLSNFLWCLPRVLFNLAPVCRKAISDCTHWNYRSRICISGCTICSILNETLPEISTPANLGWLAHVHPCTRRWFFYYYYWWSDCYPRSVVWCRFRDSHVPYHQYG